MKWNAVLGACFLIFSLQGQSRFIWPLDSPFVLTGNYGEIRPNHFHAGLDFSTGGRINKKVYAIGDGYVSRIRVNAGAYGKCVYITHPGNRVSVYAHLNSFNLAIGQVVLNEQMQRKSFEVELLPAPGQIKIRQGEIVGLSGNTGSSSGPHLHFEVRDEQSETPLNPLEIFRLADAVSPVLEGVAFFDMSDTLAPDLIRTARTNASTLSQNFVLPVRSFGFSFAAHDRVQPSGRKNNVYGAELYFDGQLVYSHTLRTIDFADNRFVNEFSEKAGGLVLQKCFVPTLYPPRLYNSHLNKGVITFRDTLQHVLRLVLRDEAGNVTERTFKVRWSGKEQSKAEVKTGSTFVNCTQDFIFHEKGTRLYIPARTLYRSAYIRVHDELASSSRISISPGLNLRSAIVLSFPVPKNYADVSGKLVLRGQGGTVTGQLQKDSVYFYMKNTGSFMLMADVVPPAVSNALSAKRISQIKTFTSFSFRIKDKLSGISKYSVTVNGKWVLAEYDAKSDMLTYHFGDDTPRGPLQFLVVVEDRCGNERRHSYLLKRP